MLESTKGYPMNRTQAEYALASGARVVAHAGADTDTGHILALQHDTLGRTLATVGWDSNQQSDCDVASLELLGSSNHTEAQQ